MDRDAGEWQGTNGSGRKTQEERLWTAEANIRWLAHELEEVRRANNKLMIRMDSASKTVERAEEIIDLLSGPIRAVIQRIVETAIWAAIIYVAANHFK